MAKEHGSVMWSISLTGDHSGEAQEFRLVYHRAREVSLALLGTRQTLTW